MRIWSWQSGAFLGVAVAAGLVGLFNSDQKRLFVPGRTSAGHHQIEQACDACHTPFGGVDNRACLDCHGAELAAVKDSHGESKFKDPRTAEMLATIDATRCVTCHREHVPRFTSSMSVSVPADICQPCHAEIGSERPSHASFPADGCASTGCHRYHDNTALYEDFLLTQLDQPATKPGAVRPERALSAFFAAVDPGRRPLSASDHDASPARAADQKLLREWAESSHARSGVNCRDCHQPRGQSWTDRPGFDACRSCHDHETEGFLASRHGMRLERGLSPMTPAEALLPMKPAAAGKQLGCGSCHGAHSFDTRRAAVEACRTCHDDEHTRNYAGSPHHVLWQKELGGELPAGSGVSCATCHLPRSALEERGRKRIAVEHNQNANLRPDDKFVRSVCLDCHSAFFSFRALSDADDVRRNFASAPAAKLETEAMVRKRRDAQR